MQHIASFLDTPVRFARGVWHRLGRLVVLVAVTGLATMVWAGALAPTNAAVQAMHAPKAYVALFGDNAVAVIDTGSNQVLKTIPVPAGPEGLVASPDGTRVYATSTGASTVSVISTVTDRVVSSIEVGKTPQGLSITRDGRHVLVAVFGASRVAMIDTVRNQVIAQIPVGNPHTVAISPDDRTAYVTAQQPGAMGLAILDLSTRQQVGMIPLDKTPRAANFSPDGTAVYFTQAGVNSVQVLDPKDNQIVAQIPTGASPHLPIFTANGEYELTVVQGPGQLAVINPATRKVIGTVAVGKFPHWAAPTADGDTAYVTNEGANSVTVVNVQKQEVLATIPVGAAPRKIVIQPAPASKAGAFRRVAAQAASLTAQAGSAPVVGAAGAGIGGIQIKDFAFAPATIKVGVGEALTWMNNDSIPHTSTSADNRWNSGPIQPGASFKVAFDKAGTYQYHCSIHPFMQATVVVGD
jgi:YVTN family beta-propeller protein